VLLFQPENGYLVQITREFKMKIIVDEHQGKIDVDTQEGEYTEFTITLPKNSEPESD
jgi:sensor histidine kinase regulating citrate/malate metabolism